MMFLPIFMQSGTMLIEGVNLHPYVLPPNIQVVSYNRKMDTPHKYYYKYADWGLTNGISSALILASEAQNLL